MRLDPSSALDHVGIKFWLSNDPTDAGVPCMSGVVPAEVPLAHPLALPKSSSPCVHMTHRNMNAGRYSGTSCTPLSRSWYASQMTTWPGTMSPSNTALESRQREDMQKRNQTGSWVVTGARIHVKRRMI